MSQPIESYALIGDTHSSALVGKDGSIDWLCWPRHDSQALLCKLLDDERGGAATIALDGLAPAGRRYLDETNILQTRFRGPAGGAVLHDLMPLHPPTASREEGPDGDSQSRLLRLLSCEEGRVTGRFHLRLTPDFGQGAVRLERKGREFLVHGGELRLSLVGSHDLREEGDGISMEFSLQAGECAFIALNQQADGVARLETLDDAQRDLDHTRAYWSGWSRRIRYVGPYREAVVRSALVLKLLTYSPTGALLAAATTGLPEAVPGNRNYDYRYSWVRDASFTVTAFCNLGLTREAAEYMRFLRNADGGRKDGLRLLHGIEGTVPEERELPHLPGWRGVGPVLIGNAARDQRQYDIYGEFLVALHAYLEAVNFKPPADMLEGLPGVVRALAAHAMRHRHSTDHGIWELRRGEGHLQHTKALIWVALDRACRIARRLPGCPPKEATEWAEVAAALRAEYERETWNAARGAYMQAYGSEVLDAAVLRTVLFGALDASDPRTLSTLEAVTRELTEGDLVYRYHMDDGLEGEEASFTACAFWRVGVMAMVGRTEEAQTVFERLLARGNDVGLFAEEIDVATGEQRGNVPQAFTHMAIINHAVRLEAHIDRCEEPMPPDAMPPEAITAAE